MRRCRSCRSTTADRRSHVQLRSRWLSRGPRLRPLALGEAGALRPRAAGSAASCSSAAGAATSTTGLAQLAEARQSGRKPPVQFVKAADAGKPGGDGRDRHDVGRVRARSRAGQAGGPGERRRAAVDSRGAHYDAELRRLQDFVSRFAQNTARSIVGFSISPSRTPTSRRASFPLVRPRQAADAFRDALDGISASFAGQDKWRAEAMAATAVAAVREIQALQAPHIAEADEAVMARLETAHGGAEAAARSALATLTGRWPRPLRGPRLRAATTALDQFVDVGKQIIVFSRRNTDVESLALSMNEKRRLVQVCETELQSLQEALAKRGYPRGRY